MTYTVLIIATLALIAFLVALLLFISINTAKHRRPSKNASQATLISTPADSIAPEQKPLERQIRQDVPAQNASYNIPSYGSVNSMPGGPYVTRPIRDTLATEQGAPGTVPRSVRSRLEPVSLSPSTPSGPAKPVHAQTRYELEMEYERGMRTIYDEEVGAINFIGINIVMNTPAEVELAFHVCKRQIRAVLRSKGLEKAPTLTDIGGIVIGGEATSAWGQAFKGYLEEMCIKVGKDTYLVAHYNSHAHRPDLGELHEKIRRIQIMTSAAINNFQSNIFDTREEAVAFLVRMREIYHV